MRALVAVLLVTGTACFTKPDRPGTEVLGCSTPWSEAVPIQGTAFGSDPIHSPWLSENREQLWWGSAYAGSGLDHDIQYSNVTGQAFDNLQRVNVVNGLYQDHPFIDDGGVLWFDDGPDSTTTTINESRPPYETKTPHVELAGGIEPSLTSDAGTIVFARYFTPSEPHLWRASRAAGNSLFDAPEELMFAGPAQSPSISSTGKEIAFTRLESGKRPRIFLGTIDEAGTIVADEIHGFQSDTAWSYFDPNLSRDGETLVYAAGPDNGIALYMLTRSCN